MKDSALIIAFEGASTGEANVYASDLANAIRDIDRAVEVRQTRERPETQDFGATLAIVLGSASASAIATGISHWLARHSGVRLEIKTSVGTVIATNLDSKHAPEIAKALSAK
jgi:hypothetical protein